MHNSYGDKVMPTLGQVVLLKVEVIVVYDLDSNATIEQALKYTREYNSVHYQGKLTRVNYSCWPVASSVLLPRFLQFHLSFTDVMLLCPTPMN